MSDPADVTLFLVEDDPGHARLIEKNLRRANVANKVIKCADGQEAVDYLFGEGDYSGQQPARRRTTRERCIAATSLAATSMSQSRWTMGSSPRRSANWACSWRSLPYRTGSRRYVRIQTHSHSVYGGRRWPGTPLSEEAATGRVCRRRCPQRPRGVRDVPDRAL